MRMTRKRRRRRREAKAGRGRSRAIVAVVGVFDSVGKSEARKAARPCQNWEDWRRGAATKADATARRSETVSSGRDSVSLVKVQGPDCFLS